LKHPSAKVSEEDAGASVTTWERARDRQFDLKLSKVTWSNGEFSEHGNLENEKSAR
jgi:hypothetical protein